MRYNESAARTCTLREENWSRMSFTLWVRIMHKIATDIQQWFHTRTDIRIPYTIHHACMIDIHTVTTHMSCSLDCQYSLVSVLQLWHHSPPDSSVRGFALWRRDCHPIAIGKWKKRKETEGDTALWIEDEQPKRTLLTHLSVTLSFTGRWSHLLMSSFTQYH